VAFDGRDDLMHGAANEPARRLSCGRSVTSSSRWRLPRRRSMPASRTTVAHQSFSFGGRVLSRSVHDARLAIRRFAREPVFVVVAVAALSLGIGANTAVFGFPTRVLAPMPWPHADRLVRIYSTSPRREFDVMSYPDYADVRQAVPVIDPRPAP
jgi:hypothetical protein